MSLTRGSDGESAGRGDRRPHQAIRPLSSQRAASGAAVPVAAVPGEDVVVLHIDGGPSLVLHPENARDLLRSQEGGVEPTRGSGAEPITSWRCPSGCSGAGSRKRRPASEPRAVSSGNVVLKAIDVVTGMAAEDVARLAVADAGAKRVRRAGERPASTSSGRTR